MVSGKVPRVIVIGGGAAGFFGAIACAENTKDDVDIRIFEKSSKFLSKVKISGGGRCNVTHDLQDPRSFLEHYPRGERELIGPFTRWNQEDTVWWFREHGVDLKTEDDGRIFPVSDSSQTIIDSLISAAREGSVSTINNCTVNRITKLGDGSFQIYINREENPIEVDFILIATGGIRSASSRELLHSFDHKYSDPVPSLFTFEIEDYTLNDLTGLSVTNACVEVPSLGIKNYGPLLITHWGLSGPVILKLSALGARVMEEINYQFMIRVNWLGEAWTSDRLRRIIDLMRDERGSRLVVKKSPLEETPNRLWKRICMRAGIKSELKWSELKRDSMMEMINFLISEEFEVTGKSLNKEEFVTCGGVRMEDIDLKTMESKLVKNLFFAGEVMDVDGLTGGFNFQSAWTTGRIAGEEIAQRCMTSF